MTNTTQDSIIKVILSLRAETGKTKLPVSQVAERAGLSRQALYKYHDRLLPYIAGTKPIEELFDDSDELDSNNHSGLQKYAFLQQRIFDLNAEIDILKKQHEKAIQDEQHRITTSLMMRDIEINDSRLTRSELQNKTIQLNNRIKDLKISEDKVSKLESEVSVLKRKLSASSSSSSDQIHKITITSDDTYHAIEQINEQASHTTSGIVFFIDRWNYPFSSFVDNDIREAGEYFYLSAHLFTARERKRAIKKIQSNIPVIAVIPTVSEANTKWFRHLHCAEITQEQFEKADSAWQPILLNEGFNQILEFKAPEMFQQGEEP